MPRPVQAPLRRIHDIRGHSQEHKASNQGHQSQNMGIRTECPHCPPSATRVTYCLAPIRRV
jgi:hypothetical protein